MSVICEHPFCTRLISSKCLNHCQLDLCEEHLIEHKNLFLVQYEKLFNNLKKTFQSLLDSFEETKKRIDMNYQKKISLINDNSSNEFEEKSLLIISTENLIKKKLQLLNDVKIGQALLYQYDIEQIKLYRTIIGNYQSMETEIFTSSSSASSSNSNFNPESDNDEEEEEEEDDDDDANDKNYYHKSDVDTKRNIIMNYYGQCPLTRLGIYGLHEKHNLVLCTLENNQSDHHLMTHFYNHHHIKWSLAYELTGAIINKLNPMKTYIFKSHIDIIDKRFYVRYCPLKEMKLSNCRKKFFKDSLEQHLANVHHLSSETRNKIVQTIENNGSLTALDLDENEFK
jgi:hypothetical protein